MIDELGDASLARAAADARVEWRADEEEWTAAALEQWRHGRTLVDVAREHLHRGDVIAIQLPDSPQLLQGTVIGVALDVIALDSFAGRVDVHLRVDGLIAWQVVEYAPIGGGRGLVVDSFRARLLELETAGDPVEVCAATIDALHRGVLTVGRDHVVLDDTDGGCWVIALSALQWVRPASPR